MSTEDIDDHARRIAELERKVTALYQRIGQLEPLAQGDGFASGAGATPPPINDPRVLEALQSGDKIGAIKAYRELTGVGLAEAKDAIDSVAGG